MTGEWAFVVNNVAFNSEGLKLSLDHTENCALRFSPKALFNAHQFVHLHVFIRLDELRQLFITDALISSEMRCLLEIVYTALTLSLPRISARL